MRKIAEIIMLLKEKYFLKNDKAVAEKIEIDPDALSMHKKRETLPLKQLIDFCAREHISLDWLLLGRGEPTPAEPTEDIEKRLARLEKLVKGKK